jgi:FkbM family methyltransferase
MQGPELTHNAGIAGLDIWSRCLLQYARCALPLPGRKSAFRKFRRRRTGSRFRVFTRHGFWLNGEIGDSVENQVAVFGEFEPGLSRVLKTLAGITASFVDLGCNIGYFTCLYGVTQRRGRIVGVDANPLMAQRCQENLRLNSIEASVLNLAVGDADRQTVLNIPRGRPTRGTIGQIDGNSSNSNSIAVQMKPLETILNQEELATVDLMKVDIEGYELKLFQSLRPELASRFSAIVFEFSEPNLRQCGCRREEFAAVTWIKQFQIFALDEPTGRLWPVSSLDRFEGAEGTIFLQRRDSPWNLPTELLG